MSLKRVKGVIKKENQVYTLTLSDLDIEVSYPSLELSVEYLKQAVANVLQEVDSDITTYDIIFEFCFCNTFIIIVGKNDVLEEAIKRKAG